MSKSKAEWVVMGGKTGELAHCTRCGVGLELKMPQPIPVVIAASNAFVKMHLHCKEGQHQEPKATTPGEWFRGRDTGTSSFTIFFVMTGTYIPRGNYDVPHDPADFGRCYRLLNLFPKWKTRMPEVAVRFPEWRRLVERWDELTKLYEEESPAKTAPKLYARMKELTSRA